MGTSKFSERLRILRQRKGWSQSDLAKKAGMHHDTISKIETGARKVKWDRALLLAAALGCSLEDFLGETTSTSSTANAG